MCKVILITTKALVTMNNNNNYYLHNDGNDTSTHDNKIHVHVHS